MKELLVEILLPVLLAFAVVSVIHPWLVKIAYTKSLVDKPNARRLNKQPVPILGGVGIFLGIILSVCICASVYDVYPSFVVFVAATLMLYTGVIDDILNIKPRNKFLMQLFAVGLLIFAGGLRLDFLHGLWGVYGMMPMWLSIPLTLVACVGVVNGINLIDGVDGLSSGYGILTAIVCGIVFWAAGDAEFAILSFAIVGALLPFFIHNVFGRKYKMFLGDGGSLLLGLLFSVIIIRIDQAGATLGLKGVVSFILAVFSLPVFDTLRVMTTRILKGRSPFSPDKTHMHHLFVEMGYNHPMCTLIVLVINFSSVLVWFILEMIPAVSIDLQFYITLSAALLINLGVYFGITGFSKRHPGKFVVMCDNIRSRQIRRQGVFKSIQRGLDRL